MIYKCTICGRELEVDESQEETKSRIEKKIGRKLKGLTPLCGKCYNDALVKVRHVSKN